MRERKKIDFFDIVADDASSLANVNLIAKIWALSLKFSKW